MISKCTLLESSKEKATSFEPFLGRSVLVEVKLGHHFAELLGDQQRRGQGDERSPFGCPSFCVASVPPEATEFDGRFGGHRLAYSIERCHHGRMVAFSRETWSKREIAGPMKTQSDVGHRSNFFNMLDSFGILDLNGDQRVLLRRAKMFF
jgi:hypothetical protein